MTTSSTGGASVAVDSISKFYGGTCVLDSATFHVPTGSFTSFLGPSGSGKTTTLSIIAGLVRADRGRVEIDGRDHTHVAVNKRGLGFVYQSYALFPHMTVGKNIAYSLMLRRVPRAERRRRVAEVLEVVHLTGFERRHPNQLSGGQQQRVALARAVVAEPRALLMDEPLGALDAGLRAHLQREIVRIGRELGITILYVTHDQSEALSMSDQIVLFNRGQVEQIASPREIYSQPASEFAAQFIGAGALVRGTLERNGDQWVVVGVGGHCPVGEAAVTAGGLTQGAPAAAVVRPESVELSPAGADGPAACHRVGRAVVTDVIFGGDHLIVRAGLAGGEVVEHRCAELRELWAPGFAVDVHVRAQRLPYVVPCHGPDTSSPADAPSPDLPARDPNYSLPEGAVHV